jgi:molybdopterin molybdotransferase
MWEHTEESDGTIEIKRKSTKSNICRQGEDLNEGDVLCPKGTHLTPLALANIALGGVASINASKRPTAAVFSTGDELLPAGAHIEPRKIFDSNGPMLSALLAHSGIAVAFTGHIPDNLDESVAGLRKGLDEAEVVLLTGAVSKGDYDFLPEAFRQVGLETHFDEIAVKPGKPTTFATTEDKMVFGLPGNPVSAFLMFHIFVLPALLIMQGSNVQPRFVKCPIELDIKSIKNERDQFIPAKLSEDGLAIPLEYHGSGHLTALAQADGFIRIESGVTSIAAGEKVSFLPLMVRAYTGMET